MRKRHSGLLATAAAAALVCGMAGSASAFDVVDWTWDKDVTETVGITILVQSVLVPDGLVEIEKLQMYFGDVKAVAKVDNIDNTPPVEGGENGGPFTVETNVGANIEWAPGPSGTAQDNPLTGGSYTPVNPAFTITALPGGNADESNGEDGNDAEFFFHVAVEVDPQQIGAPNFDAADLPKIENAATAVANNQSITSDVPIMLHDAQFYAGGFNDYGDASQGEVIQGVLGLLAAGFAFDEYADDNIHTALALAMTAAAAGGIIEPGEVEAKAKVSDILNAYVENAATAVVNNASFKIESGVANNHILVADLTQWAYADTTARAKVEDVEINGYTGFGDACFGGACEDGAIIKPIVANTATAVGNNLNIKVGTVLE